MWTINRIMTAVFDVLYVPLGVLPRWASLMLISCVVGLVALVVLKYCSNQRAIARVKNDIKANMLAIKLFKDDVRVMFQAQRRLIWAALRMQYHMLPPLLVMLVPFVLIAAQMGLRYQWRAFAVGDERPAHLCVTVSDASNWSNLSFVIDKHPAFEIDPTPVRAVSDGTVTWRLRAKRDGAHLIRLTQGGETFTKEVAVGERVDRVSPMRPDGGFFDNLLYPAEKPFAAGSRVKSITLNYPARDSWYAGADWWILWFLVISMAFALILKPILKVKF